MATISINGIANHTRIRMVDFLRIHDIDIALLQEVTSPQIVTIRRYTKHINIGTKRRGTAILAKEDLSHTNLKILPPGRGIAATFNGTCLVNIYAQSGTAKKRERERFYNNDLPYMLASTQTDLILAGEFNCVLSQTDSTGQRKYSSARANLVNGLGLTDVYETNAKRSIYTHYTSTGASRLD